MRQRVRIGQRTASRARLPLVGSGAHGLGKPNTGRALGQRPGPWFHPWAIPSPASIRVARPSPSRARRTPPAIPSMFIAPGPRPTRINRSTR